MRKSMSMAEKSEQIRMASNDKMAGILDRSIFLYMDPRPENQDIFAECGSCSMFLPSIGRCSLHGPDIEITPSKTCGLYVPGEQVESEIEHLRPAVTPSESGLTEMAPRCENCKWFWGDVSECGLFKILNENHPYTMDLKEKVHPKGCCNAQTPRA